MAKVVTMGEIMLRLSTPNNEKFIQADEFDVNYGGGEANVAVSLANYGHDTQFVTAVPANPIFREGSEGYDQLHAVCRRMHRQ